MPANLLVVDDDPDLLQLLSMRLTAAGYRVTGVGSAEAALAHLEAVRPQLVVSDVQLPGRDGLALFDEIRARHPALPVILLTAHGTIPDAVEATARGVFTYLTKPFDGKALLDKIAQALALGAPEAHREGPDEAWRAPIVSRSAVMAEVLAEAKMVAASDASVLICGESGSGKELLAQSIHRASPRAGKPFVAVNCSAIPEALLESELFGHVKGSFTGAVANHRGLFQAADGGTLFLDEIGDMPPALQVKLLRVLQERRLERLGSNDEVTVDVRVVAATKADLLALAEQGRFRADLYYRLHVAVLRVPPLRERREDIPLLFEHFVLQAAGRHDLPARQADAGMLQRLMAQDWPGNVRELRNVAERFVLGLGVDPMVEPSGADLTLQQQMDRVEKVLIEQALRLHRGRLSSACEALGIGRKTLYDKIARLQIDVEPFRLAD